MSSIAQKKLRTPAARLVGFLEANRVRFPANADFARELSCSEGRLSQLLAGKGGPPRAKLAQRIQQHTGIPAGSWYEEALR